MKLFYTCLLFCGMATASWGQDRKPEVKVETRTIGMVPVHRILEKAQLSGGPLVRLYRRPNARVKKALSFTTQAQRPKIA